MIAALLLCMSPTVDLAAVGDVMLGRYVGRRILREGTGAIFGACAAELNGADFAMGNLECVLTRRTPTANKQIRLVADPKLAPVLKDSGFDALSVANNHALDAGQPGLADTVSTLSKASLRAVTSHPHFVSVKGIRIALLAFSDFDDDDLGPQLTARTELAKRLDEIRWARKRSDVVVVMWHWGVELSSMTSLRQRELAADTAKAGADLILGSHPHVLQPIEWLPGAKGRRCLVAYSLGNFIFDARPGLERKSGILHVSLDRSGVNAYRLSPYHIDHASPHPG